MPHDRPGGTARARQRRPQNPAPASAYVDRPQNTTASIVLLPLYGLVFFVLHVGFGLIVLSARASRRIIKVWSHFTATVTKQQFEQCFERVGRQLRLQIDASLATADNVQVIHNAELPRWQLSMSAAGTTISSLKIPRHLAIVFATRSDSLARTVWRVLASKLSPSTHSWEQQQERDLLERKTLLLQQTSQLIRWAALIGIDQVSVYDDGGLLKQYFQHVETVSAPQRWHDPSANSSFQQASSRELSSPDADSRVASRPDSGESSTDDASSASEVASSDFDVFSNLGTGMSSSASSLPPHEDISPQKLPAKTEDRIEPTLRLMHNRAYRINVELCVSGRHDVSVEAQRLRRTAVTERRRMWMSESQPLAPHPLHVILNVLSREDGKVELARAAEDLMERVREQTEEELLLDRREEHYQAPDHMVERKQRRAMRELLLDRIDGRKVDQALEERGCMGEPELLLVKGGSRRLASLHGFPPWPLRISEIYHCATSRNVDELHPEDLVNALLQYSGSTQRYGR